MYKLNKNKILTVAVLLLVVVVILFTLIKKFKKESVQVNSIILPVSEMITKEKAEEIASPIISTCWNYKDNKIETKIVSISTTLLNKNKEFASLSNDPFWRVGGNYSEKGFPFFVNETYGNIPEVLVDAYTGEILHKHFSELGPALYQGCEDTDSVWYTDTAKPLVVKTLEEWFKREGGVSDYKINKIDFVADKINGPSKEYIKKGMYVDSFSEIDSNDAFIVSVDFSLKSTQEKIGTWVAGNGELSTDGWVMNKFMYIKIDKNSNNHYNGTVLGTGL